jgi:hypothetical protein
MGRCRLNRTSFEEDEWQRRERNRDTDREDSDYHPHDDLLVSPSARVYGRRAALSTDLREMIPQGDKRRAKRHPG